MFSVFFFLNPQVLIECGVDFRGIFFLNNRFSNYSKWIKISVWLREHSIFDPSLNEAFGDSNSSFYFSMACFFEIRVDPHSPREPLDAEEGIHQRGKKKSPLSEPKKKKKREPSISFVGSLFFTILYSFDVLWDGMERLLCLYQRL